MSMSWMATVVFQNGQVARFKAVPPAMDLAKAVGGTLHVRVSGMGEALLKAEGFRYRGWNCWGLG